MWKFFLSPGELIIDSEVYIPLFINQIKNKKDITVTNPND